MQPSHLRLYQPPPVGALLGVSGLLCCLSALIWACTNHVKMCARRMTVQCVASANRPAQMPQHKSLHIREVVDAPDSNAWAEPCDPVMRNKDHTSEPPLLEEAVAGAETSGHPSP